MDMTLALRAGVPITAALLLLAVTVAARKQSPRAPAPVQPPICELTTQLEPEPEARVPGPDVYALLDKCLREGRHPWNDPNLSVTVEQVRYWVGVEHDPIWFEKGAWWLPMSGEGEGNWPSGIYISVPIDGSACGGALVN